MSLPAGVELIRGSDDAAVDKVCKDFGLTREQFQQLQRRSEAAKATCYAPYSKFRVGAVVLATRGPHGDGDAYVAGANVENASYPVGVCAEVTTFSTAITSGYSSFKALSVATDISPPASPCGRCRQFIREFCDLRTPIFMFDVKKDFVVMKLEALLPLSFGPENLPPPTS